MITPLRALCRSVIICTRGARRSGTKPFSRPLAILTCPPSYAPHSARTMPPLCLPSAPTMPPLPPPPLCPCSGRYKRVPARKVLFWYTMTNSRAHPIPGSTASKLFWSHAVRPLRLSVLSVLLPVPARPARPGAAVPPPPTYVPWPPPPRFYRAAPHQRWYLPGESPPPNSCCVRRVVQVNEVMSLVSAAGGGRRRGWQFWHGPRPAALPRCRGGRVRGARVGDTDTLQYMSRHSVVYLTLNGHDQIWYLCNFGKVWTNWCEAQLKLSCVFRQGITKVLSTSREGGQTLKDTHSRGVCVCVGGGNSFLPSALNPPLISAHPLLCKYHKTSDSWS